MQIEVITDVKPIQQLAAAYKIEHGKLTEYNWLVQYPERFSLAPGTDIGAFTYINAKHGVTIKKTFR